MTDCNNESKKICGKEKGKEELGKVMNGGIREGG